MPSDLQGQEREKGRLLQLMERFPFGILSLTGTISAMKLFETVNG